MSTVKNIRIEFDDGSVKESSGSDAENIWKWWTSCEMFMCTTRGWRFDGKCLEEIVPPTPPSIKFYRSKDPYFCFSNFSRHKLVIDGLKYPTSEHYYQSMKYYGVNPDRMEKVRLSKTAREAADLGRNSMYPIRPDWDAVKDDVMRKTIHEKFSQHVDLAKMLVDTGDKILIEDSDRDSYWGCGKDGTGKNMLGVILMEERTKLKQ